MYNNPSSKYIGIVRLNLFDGTDILKGLPLCSELCQELTHQVLLQGWPFYSLNDIFSRNSIFFFFLLQLRAKHGNSFLQLCWPLDMTTQENTHKNGSHRLVANILSLSQYTARFCSSVKFHNFRAKYGKIRVALFSHSYRAGQHKRAHRMPSGKRSWLMRWSFHLIKRIGVYPKILRSGCFMSLFAVLLRLSTFDRILRLNCFHLQSLVAWSESLYSNLSNCNLHMF